MSDKNLERFTKLMLSLATLFIVISIGLLGRECQVVSARHMTKECGIFTYLEASPVDATWRLRDHSGVTRRVYTAHQPAEAACAQLASEHKHIFLEPPND